MLGRGWQVFSVCFIPQLESGPLVPTRSLNLKISTVNWQANQIISPFLPSFKPPGRTRPEKTSHLTLPTTTAGRSSSIPPSRGRGRDLNPNFAAQKPKRKSTTEAIWGRKLVPTGEGPHHGAFGWCPVGLDWKEVDGWITPVIGTMGWLVHLLINGGLYWGYNPLTNVLLPSWDIQVDGWEKKTPVGSWRLAGVCGWNTVGCFWLFGFLKNKEGRNEKYRKESRDPQTQSIQWIFWR